MATYYFDGSDASATDPNSNYTNDANAFDSMESTYASGTSAGSSSTNYLMAEGTNAPSSGTSIIQVTARVYKQGGSNTTAEIYTDGLAEMLGTTTTSANGWNTPVTLTEPTGGWTWAKVQSLEVKLYKPSGAPSADAGMVQVEVYSDPIPSRIYRIQGFQ